MVTTDWSGVRERIEALARKDKAQVVFGAWNLYGAQGHQFRLAAPLLEEQISEAEAQLRVSLPEDYRAFLVQVGAGGAGPAYGISSLIQEGGAWSWSGPGAESDLDQLHLPFPRHDVIVEALAEQVAQEPVEQAFDSREEYLRAFRAWDDEGEALFGQLTTGAVCLGHEGCGTYDWLVVSGAERGSVWFDDRPTDAGLTPLGPPDARVRFSEWYLNWLDASEARVDHENH
ncbi:SMI1/KNR4 family protein [Kitasatospora sp. NPDC057223]|uniref:SMI1/KNR4 family protein n=1 Tax=Kitasatospora sp. NPDC057223 TaxID=3346055 RepID=UPI00363900D7